MSMVEGGDSGLEICILPFLRTLLSVFQLVRTSHPNCSCKLQVIIEWEDWLVNEVTLLPLSYA